MSRQWMYGDRCHPEFINGMHYFLNVAEANRRSNGFMYCPCSSCKNMKDYSTSKTLHVHLLENGFMPSYNCWTKHGERGVILEDNEEEEDSDNYPLFTEDGDSRMGEDEAEEEPIFDEPIFDDPDDDLGRAILDAKMNCGNEKERLKLEKMLEDHNKLLYPNCENGQKKLGTTLELLQWKAENGTSDKGFEKLLKIINKMLPGENVLPSSTYEAKKVVCPLGLEVQKIHACINDCILYRGEYENLNACPVCSALRYKIRRDDPGDVEGESTPRKRVPAKVMWYAPIIPQLKCLFQNKEHAKLLRWHKEDRKKDVMLRHPADGSQWRKIDREFKSFSDDARNLRFGLSTDGFNPFGEQKTMPSPSPSSARSSSSSSRPSPPSLVSATPHHAVAAIPRQRQRHLLSPRAAAGTSSTTAPRRRRLSLVVNVFPCARSTAAAKLAVAVKVAVAVKLLRSSASAPAIEHPQGVRRYAEGRRAAAHAMLRQ
nr:uncharacterized protein LOC127347667 [Lolium perenne]